MGVPQGSVFCQFFFLIIMVNLPKYVTIKYVDYADDIPKQFFFVKIEI